MKAGGSQFTSLECTQGWRVSRTASPRQGGETGLFSSPAVACNSRENSGVFRRSSRDGRLLCPTAGAVFMLLRSAMSAAAGHAISPFMLSACVGAGLTIPWCHSLLSYLAVLSATAEYQPLNPSMWPTLTPLLTPDRGGCNVDRNDGSECSEVLKENLPRVR